MDELEKLWPTLSSSFVDNLSFLEHEWTKHGSCQQLPIVEYFLSTVKLMKSISVDSALKTAVGVGNVKSKTDFEKAIKRKMGQEINSLFLCKPTTLYPKLKEIILCVDKNIERIVSCDGPAEEKKIQCGGNILFP